jgi:hypothetical protein
MMRKRINIDFTGMAGFGPAAWKKDHQVLKMYTPHHEKNHHPNHGDAEDRRAAGQANAATPRKEDGE